MKKLYIIVHEAEVEAEISFLGSSVLAYREIGRIKSSEDFRSVDWDDPTVIPSDLPDPEGCKLFVCGSSIASCVPQQIEALKKAGYDAELYRKASIY